MLFLFLLIYSLTEVASLLLALNQIKNGTLLNFYTFIEFVFIGLIYHLEIKSKNYYKYFLICIIIYTLVFIVNGLFYNGFNSLDSFTSTLSSTLIISFCIYYFTYTLNTMEIISLTKNYFFWLNGAFFFYFTCSLFIFIFSTYILNEKSKQHRYLWLINYFLSIIYNLIICLSIYKWKKAKT